MAITTVGLLGGTAEIQGTQREFFWDGKDLSIKGLGYGDVTRILDQLAAGVMWDERPPTHPKQVGVKFPEVSPAAPVASAAPQPKASAPAPVSTRPGELPINDAPPARPDAPLDHALMSADSLMKVLTILKSKGFSEWKPMLDECQRLRADVPVLKKINETEFKDRILRVASTKLQIAVPEDA